MDLLGDAIKMPVFAIEVDASLLAAAGTILTAAGSAFGWFLNYLNSKRKDSLAEWQSIVARQDAHLVEQQKIIGNQQTTIEQYQTRMAELQQGLTLLYQLFRNLAANAAAAGVRVDPIPDLPSFGSDIGAAAEFAARSSAFNVSLLRDEAVRAISGAKK